MMWLAVMLFILAVFAVWAGALGPSAKPSLSRKEKRYLHELYYECDIMLPRAIFFDLALVLWHICAIEPLRLKKMSNLAEDFDLGSLGRIEFITRVGRALDIAIEQLKAERIFTFYDLVKCLEAGYVKKDDSREVQVCDT